VAYYHALNVGGKASTVVPFTALYPLVTIVLAVVWLRERLHAIQKAGIVLSLAAIYLLNVPSADGAATPWFLFALIPIVLWGVTGLLQKVTTHHISGELATLAFLAAFLPVAAGLLLFEPLAGPPGFRSWLLVAGLGLSFSLGNYAFLLAFAHGGKASIITPLAGLYPLVSVPIAIAFLGERVGTREIAGILLGALSVVALVWEQPLPATRLPAGPSQQPP
jgi:uncharacterized membrane protein